MPPSGRGRVGHVLEGYNCCSVCEPLSRAYGVCLDLQYFNPRRLDSTSVASPGFQYWSGPSLTDLVQSWVRNQTSNYGFIIVGQIETEKSAVKFASTQVT